MLRLRYLRLRSITGTTRFGADLSFSAGLNVIYAGNTSGKSTCLQAIIYALGLERSLGPQLEVPLPYAMRERIHAHITREYQTVIQSYVELELENGEGQILTVHRDIVGGADTKLIRTWNAPRLSHEAISGTRRDFFVHDAGAAQREDGFHNFLANFMRWQLPQVPRFDGNEGPLYLEAIFPMLFVEQKRGWSAIQGPFPTFLRIQDVARRVMEFLLDLDVGKIRRDRAEIRRQLQALHQQWSSLRSRIEDQAVRVVRIRGIPETPSAEFALKPVIEIDVLQEAEWQPIAQVLANLEARISELEGAVIPTADTIAPELEARLANARSRVESLSASVETLRSDYGVQLQENRAIHARLASLEIDLKRNQDALKLKKLGSDLGRAAVDHVCPTCHQEITSELLPTVSTVNGT